MPRRTGELGRRFGVVRYLAREPQNIDQGTSNDEGPRRNLGHRQTSEFGFSGARTTDFQSVGDDLGRRTGSPSYRRDRSPSYGRDRSPSYRRDERRQSPSHEKAREGARRSEFSRRPGTGAWQPLACPPFEIRHSLFDILLFPFSCSHSPVPARAEGPDCTSAWSKPKTECGC
jgi:hypothetical protein